MQSFKTTYSSPIHFAPYSASSLTRVYVIHNQTHELHKCANSLDALPGFCLIGWQTNRNVAIKDIIQLRPELIVVYSATVSGLDFALARAIKEEVPATSLIFISSEPLAEQLKILLQSGASGFCLRSTTKEVLNLALQTVAFGGVWIDPTAASNIFLGESNTDFQEELPQPLLSDREKEVLHLIADGLTNGEIALRLWLSRETVKSHVKKIMRKLAVKDRTQAAVAALRLGLSV